MKFWAWPERTCNCGRAVFVVILHSIYLEAWRCKLPKPETVVDTNVHNVFRVLCRIDVAKVVRAGTICPEIDGEEWPLQTGLDIAEEAVLLGGFDLSSVRRGNE